jgi:lysine 6-dehydrogenase
MGFDYAVIGAGRQGTAAAYDLAVHGEASSVVVGDIDEEAARRAADRVNELSGTEVASPLAVDVGDADALVDALQARDVVVCAVPYRFILAFTAAAIEAGTGMVDLGGHTPTVLAQWEMGGSAERRGTTVVPDCGMGPGMNNTLAVYAVECLEAKGAIPQVVRTWDGGLPQQPKAPWGYESSFDLEGLSNEYSGRAVFLRGGRVVEVEALTEVEEIEVEGIGTLEAFVTSGGTSTLPYSYTGKLIALENKTCRYPGHHVRFKAFRDLGLLDDQPVLVPGTGRLRPRDLFHVLAGPQLTKDRVQDVAMVRARAEGHRDGERMTIEVEIIDRHDPATGFTAMARLTGWHAAIMAHLIARGEVPAGVRSLETAIPATRFLEEVHRRGFAVSERWGV